MATVFMFPGQGSQSVGMGSELFDRYPELVAEADEILGYSIKELCIENPDEKCQDSVKNAYPYCRKYLDCRFCAASLRCLL